MPAAPLTREPVPDHSGLGVPRQYESWAFWCAGFGWMRMMRMGRGCAVLPCLLPSLAPSSAHCLFFRSRVGDDCAGSWGGVFCVGALLCHGASTLTLSLGSALVFGLIFHRECRAGGQAFSIHFASPLHHPTRAPSGYSRTHARRHSTHSTLLSFSFSLLTGSCASPWWNLIDRGELQRRQVTP